ncbi:aminopeptidase N [Dysgonomonas sp. PH5-45]|uniref:M1 family metallopeptidase n=1 Tax=unclassified Dysgonomonas TaxID=2630389 RepID=UPI002476874F|nr:MULTISPECIES: M1 family aminopeptidase [unclassified Dysgonomonas]MDH6355251.1 aminopeptidase N [Dysgonomonas sp. PH5-45]MDH6388127.1 aminopeptidase N [Dysgonomonas sp. PH5-37]
MKQNYFLAGCLLFFYVLFTQNANGHTNQVWWDNLPQKNNRNILKVLPTEPQYAYDVKWYFLNLHAENNTVQLSGDVTIKAEVILPSMETFSFHLHADYTIDSVFVNGIKKEFLNKGDERLVTNLNFEKGTLFDVRIHYHGALMEDNGHFSGIRTQLEKSTNKNVTWTLSQPNNAYQWFPVKQDLTDKVDSVWVFVTTSNINKVASNGLLSNVVPLPDNKVRYEWKSNYPIDYYLISIAVADYMDYSFYAEIPEAKTNLLVQNYIYNDSDFFEKHKPNIDKTRDMITYFSSIFGPYPFQSEKYGHAAAPMGGGMEHQTMTTLSIFSEGVIAHELAHQWFGDNVTCSSWEYVWLNEGFAMHAEYLWYEHLYGQKYAFDAFNNNILENIRIEGKEGSVYVPAQYIDDADRIFSNILTYYKGAALVHMLRHELGDDLFFKMLRAYQQKFANSSANLKDFIDVLSELSGEDFTYFFDQWFYGEGYPCFNITWQETDSKLYLKSDQTTTVPATTPLFKINFDLQINYEDGSSELVSFFQGQTSQYFSHDIPSDKKIRSITFDPSHWLLTKAEVRQGTASVENEFADSDISVSTNTTTKTINIEFGSALNGEKVIQLFNNSGKMVLSTKSNSTTHIISTSNLDSGVYILSVSCGGNIYNEKLIILPS